MGQVKRLLKWSAMGFAALFLTLVAIEFLSGASSYRANIAMAEDAIRAQARDPSSLIFRNVSVIHMRGQGDRVCGEVNAKNGYGGYGGFRAFAVVPQPSGRPLVGIVGQTTGPDWVANECRLN